MAWTAHALTPAFTWPAAFVLAATVSPPDPVAATTVMRPLGAPGTLVSILEGEGLVNDATALVAYRIAVAAAVTGTFSPMRAAVGLLVTGAGGWAGMRGGDSLVVALALPLTTAAGRPFPARDLIVFVTFAVIFATLVLQGLSLGPLLRLLGLRGEGRADTEEAHARAGWRPRQDFGASARWRWPAPPA